MEIKYIKYLIFVAVLNFSSDISSENLNNKDYFIKDTKPQFVSASKEKTYKGIDYEKVSEYELLVDSVVYKIEKQTKTSKNIENLPLKEFLANSQNIPKYAYKLSSQDQINTPNTALLKSNIQYKPIDSLRVLLVNGKVKFSNGSLIAIFTSFVDYDKFATENNLELVRAFPSINKAVYKHPDFDQIESDLNDLRLKNPNLNLELAFIDPDVISE